MVSNNTPDLPDLLANYENRLNQIEYDVGMLQGRMPKSPWRRVGWWVSSLVMLAVPIGGGYAVLFTDDPWKTMIAISALGWLTGGAITRFVRLASRGARPHRSLLMEDHR